ncbi:hypothetical protein GGR57DRAFT_506788 [Xylariaceae sp. FL1272]|nr:hypothetical protein GGR57DRAFT_506788 [Xylariaceae sp. FL1272]
MGMIDQITQETYLVPIICLLAAVATAIGHHEFYQGLQGTPPPTDEYEIFKHTFPTRFSRQQINTAIGVIFAAVVKALLSIAVGYAQQQLIWRAIKKRAVELGLIDGLFSSKTNVIDLFNVRLWWRFPCAMLLAVIYWLLPLTAVVAPATLSVNPSSLVTTHTMMAVPTIDFLYGKFRGDISGNVLGSTENYTEPLGQVTRAVTRSLFSGDVVSLEAPFSNSTYHTSFFGPVLRCQDVDKNSSAWKNQSDTIFDISNHYHTDYNYTQYEGLAGDLQQTKVNYLDFTSIATNDKNMLRANVLKYTIWDADAALATGLSPNETNWSYQAVLKVIQDNIIGSIMQNQLFWKINTSALATVLPFSNELVYLQNSSYFWLTKSGMIEGSRNTSLKDTLEDMSRNATISLASEPLLLKQLPLSDTNVTSFSYESRYTYSASILWVAYGLAIGITAISITTGCVAATLARGGYSDKFSTILRVAHNIRLSDDMEISETSGKNHLPRRLEKILVYIPCEGVAAVPGTERGARHEEQDHTHWEDETSDMKADVLAEAPLTSHDYPLSPLRQSDDAEDRDRRAEDSREDYGDVTDFYEYPSREETN